MNRTVCSKSDAVKRSSTKADYQTPVRACHHALQTSAEFSSNAFGENYSARSVPTPFAVMYYEPVKATEAANSQLNNKSSNPTSGRCGGRTQLQIPPSCTAQVPNPVVRSHGTRASLWAIFLSVNGRARRSFLQMRLKKNIPPNNGLWRIFFSTQKPK